MTRPGSKPTISPLCEPDIDGAPWLRRREWARVAIAFLVGAIVGQGLLTLYVVWMLQSAS